VQGTAQLRGVEVLLDYAHAMVRATMSLLREEPRAGGSLSPDAFTVP